MGILWVVVSLAASQEKPTPWDHTWAKCKEGSFVTMKLSVSGVIQQEMTAKTTVKSVAADQVVLELESQGPEQPPEKRERRISLKGLPGGPDDKSKKIGEEEVEVEGKKFTCEIWEYETESISAKTWICKGVNVAGNCLKFEQTSKGGKIQDTTKGRVVKLQEDVAVGDKRVTCTVFELEGKNAQGEMKGKAWVSDEVPGAMVKAELDQNMGGQEMRITMEVTAFVKN